MGATAASLTIMVGGPPGAFERVRPLFFKRLAMAIERWTYRNADGLVFVSSVFRDRAIAAHTGIAPAIITPNAANIDKFTFTQAQRDDTRRRYGLEGHVVCGYLGAFVPWHAIDRFVHQIADRLLQSPHLKLLLVGDGSAMYTLQSLWTMARENLDICTVIFANDTYRILHGELLNVGATPGRNVARMFDMVEPTLDWVALAQGHGVQAVRVETADAFNTAFAEAMKAKGPRLIVVPC